MRIAVASQDGQSVDTHFGHAKQFRIYEVTDATSEFLETRQVDQFCIAGQAINSAMDGILAAVSDCRAVLVAMIGEGPRKMLATCGIQAVSDYANQSIETALREYVRRQEGQ